MKILPYRLWLYFLAIFYVSWTTYKLWTDAADRNPFFVSGTLVFFVLYVIPFTVFQAKVESKPDGLHVLQYRSVVIPYSDVKRCMACSLFLFRSLSLSRNAAFRSTCWSRVIISKVFQNGLSKTANWQNPLKA
jgi:hypothetical protein